MSEGRSQIEPHLRYGYEDDVYGSCSCGETRPHRHDGDDFGSSVDVPLLDASASGSRRLDDATAPASSTGVLS